MIGEIHITSDYAGLIDSLTQNLKVNNYSVFTQSEFKIDDARELIAQCYLASEVERLVILGANTYDIKAQNALLKITEEPPENIRFILIGKNRHTFLPTIRSRLKIITHKQEAQIPPFPLNIKRLNLADIYTFLRQSDKEKSSKEDIKIMIQSLLDSIHKSGIRLNEKELNAFDKAIYYSQNAATQKQSYIFLPLLLNLLQKVKNL